MAGSYQHCIDDNGKFREDDFTDMIENLGDAYEACEEMVFMINFLAEGDRKRIQVAEVAFRNEKRREKNKWLRK